MAHIKYSSFSVSLFQIVLHFLLRFLLLLHHALKTHHMSKYRKVRIKIKRTNEIKMRHDATQSSAQRTASSAQKQQLRRQQQNNTVTQISNKILVKSHGPNSLQFLGRQGITAWPRLVSAIRIFDEIFFQYLL
jgi:hypothetical protein